MLFTSFQFIVFLFVCLCLYYTLPRRGQWMYLLLFSVFFYYNLLGKITIFIVFSALTTWLATNLIEHIKRKEKAALAKAKASGASRSERQLLKKKTLPLRRLILAGFLACNVGFLLIFKFYNMFVELLAQYGTAFPLLRIAMPLGISFYTLMIVTYFVDVYSGNLVAEKNPAKVLLFTCFFPQVMQGPIARWKDTTPTLFATHTFSYNTFVLGCERMLWGYCKKIIIADRLNILTTTLFSGYETYQGLYVLVAACTYTIQLYCDFSGGMDIALGAAELFDIRLPENFNRPLFSKTIAEFWRRWHITLGSFLRDILFYPLTFSKPLAKLGKTFKSKGWRWAAKWIPTYLAMAVVWFISGIWHGEGMQYVCNGLWHGFLITMGETIATPSANLLAKWKISEDNFGLKLFRVGRTFFLVSIGEIMFRSESVAMMNGMLYGLFQCFNPQIFFDGSLLTLGLDGKDFIVAGIAILILLCISLAARQRCMRTWLNAQPLVLCWSVLLGAFISLAIFGIYGPSYDPAPFIYYQF